jgi:hypothetical protein
MAPYLFELENISYIEVGAKSSQYQHEKKIWICHKKGKLIWHKILETNNIFSNKGNRWSKKKFAVYVHWHCVEILEHIMHQRNVQLYKYIVQRIERV